MKANFAEQFVGTWQSAWNAHDVDRVLDHFHEDAIFASPIAESLLPECGGVLVGKVMIRAYWNMAVALLPTLRFTVDRYFLGVNALVIQYRNQRDVDAAEVLVFDKGLVRQGFGTYGPQFDDPAGLNS